MRAERNLGTKKSAKTYWELNQKEKQTLKYPVFGFKKTPFQAYVQY